MDYQTKESMAAEQKKMLEKFRKLAVKGTQIVYDGANHMALIGADETQHGVKMITPVVIMVPLQELLMFTANAMPILVQYIPRGVPIPIPQPSIPKDKA